MNGHLVSGGALGLEVVDAIYHDHELIVSHLNNAGEVSFSSTLEGTLPKVMLLAAASNLEAQVKGMLIEFVKRAAGDSEEVVSFLRNKAIERQYHSLFDWNKRNANQFFGLFGEEFKNRVQAHVDSDPEFQQSIRDFLDLGNARNGLVHGDYATFPMEKSASDVLRQYTSACRFVKKLRVHFGTT